MATKTPRRIVGCAFLVLAVSTISCESRKDPYGGRVRVIYCGDPLQNPSPYAFMKSEPLVDVLPIASSHWGLGIPEDQLKRFMRIYWPRTKQDLLVNFDVVLLSDANIKSFEPSQLNDVREAVTDHGFGFVMIGGGESFKVDLDDWDTTPVGEVIPVRGLYFSSGSIGTPRITDENNEFMQSLPTKELEHIRFFGQNFVTVKEGSGVLADLMGMIRNPFLVYNDYGSGRSFAMTADWTPDGGRVFAKWEYYGDFAVNMVLYAAKESLPRDIQQVHRIRQRTRCYEDTRSLLCSMLEFIERFGANTRSAETIIAEAERTRKDALNLYMNLELEPALETLNDAVGRLQDAEQCALALRRNALLWVFVTEWLAVSGTATLCAAILYTLMVRRRIYRQVASTRVGTG